MMFLLCKVVRISAKGVLVLIFLELSYVTFWNFFSTYKKQSWVNREGLTTEKRYTACSFYLNPELICGTDSYSELSRYFLNITQLTATGLFS